MKQKTTFVKDMSQIGYWRACRWYGIPNCTPSFELIMSILEDPRQTSKPSGKDFVKQAVERLTTRLSHLYEFVQSRKDAKYESVDNARQVIGAAEAFVLHEKQLRDHFGDSGYTERADDMILEADKARTVFYNRENLSSKTGAKRSDVLIQRMGDLEEVVKEQLEKAIVGTDVRRIRNLDDASLAQVIRCCTLYRVYEKVLYKGGIQGYRETAERCKRLTAAACRALEPF